MSFIRQFLIIDNKVRWTIFPNDKFIEYFVYNSPCFFFTFVMYVLNMLS